MYTVNKQKENFRPRRIVDGRIEHSTDKETKELEAVKNAAAKLTKNMLALYNAKKEEYRRMVLEKEKITSIVEQDLFEDSLLECEALMLDYRSAYHSAELLETEIDNILRQLNEN